MDLTTVDILTRRLIVELTVVLKVTMNFSLDDNINTIIQITVSVGKEKGLAALRRIPVLKEEETVTVIWNVRQD